MCGCDRENPAQTRMREGAAACRIEQVRLRVLVVVILDGAVQQHVA
jgi:hypothetical protein